MPDDKDLDALVQEIATAGTDGDSVTQALAKGMSTALGKLIDLLPRPLSKADPDAGEDEDDDGDEDEDKDGDGDGDGGGYEDLNMGAVDVDVTQFVLGIQQSVSKLHADRATDRKQLRQLAKAVQMAGEQNAQLLQLLAGSIRGQATIGAELAKGVIDLRESVAAIPEGTFTPRARLRKPTTVTDDGDRTHIGGSELAERRLLAKGLNLAILNASQRRMYHENAVFSDSAPEHERIVTALSALAV